MHQWTTLQWRCKTSSVFSHSNLKSLPNLSRLSLERWRRTMGRATKRIQKVILIHQKEVIKEVRLLNSSIANLNKESRKQKMSPACLSKHQAPSFTVLKNSQRPYLFRKRLQTLKTLITRRLQSKSLLKPQNFRKVPLVNISVPVLSKSPGERPPKLSSVIRKALSSISVHNSKCQVKRHQVKMSYSNRGYSTMPIRL